MSDNKFVIVVDVEEARILSAALVTTVHFLQSAIKDKQDRNIELDSNDIEVQKDVARLQNILISLSDYKNYVSPSIRSDYE